MFAGFLIATLGAGCVTPGGGGTELFNGKNLDGWEVTDFAGGGAIKVKDGEIHMAMGELISGINLAHENIPRTNYELEAEAMTLARSIASGPTFAHGITKTQLNQEWSMSLDQAIEAEAQAQAICMQTGDFRRAYEAFVAKQKPVFVGD